MKQKEKVDEIENKGKFLLIETKTKSRFAEFLSRCILWFIFFMVAFAYFYALWILFVKFFYYARFQDTPLTSYLISQVGDSFIVFSILANIGFIIFMAAKSSKSKKVKKEKIVELKRLK